MPPDQLKPGIAGRLRPLRLPAEIAPLSGLLLEAYADAPAWPQQRLRQELALLARLGAAYRLVRWVPGLLALPVGWAWESEPGDLAGVILTRSLRADGTVHLIDHLAVRPTLRRQGIGHRLLAAALDNLHRTDARVATLEVEPGNVAAERLYATAGFRIVDEALDLVRAATLSPPSVDLPTQAGHGEVRPQRNADRSALDRLVGASLPWVPTAGANGPARAVARPPTRFVLMRWLSDLFRAQQRRSFVVASAGDTLHASAEISVAGALPGGLPGLVSPYHRLRLLGHPDLPQDAAHALISMALAATGQANGRARPILTTVSNRQPTLLAALQRAQFVLQEHRHRLALDLTTRRPA